jgi:hypothetical protein
MNDDKVGLSEDIDFEYAPMDWSKVTLPSPKNPRPQVGELSDLDYWKLLVASKLVRKSIAAMLQTATYTYLSRNWEEHEKRLTIEANKQGISPEEMFVRLASQDGLSINTDQK